MNFGEALEQLKAGNRVARAGWNGKGQWVALIHPGNAAHRSTGGVFDMLPCLGLKNAQGAMQPGWIPSQGDLFAEDWEVCS